jgi:hypothetical protein
MADMCLDLDFALMLLYWPGEQRGLALSTQPGLLPECSLDLRASAAAFHN